MSVISSNKEYVEGHRQRLRFVAALKTYFGEDIDVFGRGINSFADKWDAISPYKYHISIENSSCENGISEKLYDSFLGESFPFYYGCKNVYDYFPVQALVSIDINQIDESLKIIESYIAKQSYEENIHYIRQSKELVIEKYNLFNLIANYCTNDINNQTKKKLYYTIKLKPEICFSNNMINKAKNRVKSFFNRLV